MVAYSKVLLICVPAVAAVGLALLWWKRNGKNMSYTKIGYVSGLFVHPVKSCKRLPIESTKCLREGMEFDRYCISRNSDIYFSTMVLASKGCFFQLGNFQPMNMNRLIVRTARDYTRITVV